MLDPLVQMEPAEALDAELAGQFAAIGIVKDQKSHPTPDYERSSTTPWPSATPPLHWAVA